MSGAGFSHIVRVERLPPRGKHFRIQAGEGERKTIAEALGIVAVDALAAELDVRPLAVGVGIRGRLEAAVVQTDVVTLEPVHQKVTEEIDVTLTPAEGEGVCNRRFAEDEPEVERDVFHGGEIDLGALAVEHLALGLDPYPRAAGVEFSGHIEDDSAEDTSPFAVLERLKRDRK
jgi:Large ribosomal RNA subunit accumulation protein YceD